MPTRDADARLDEVNEPLYCRSTGSYYPTDSAYVRDVPCETCGKPICNLGVSIYHDVCSFSCALALAEAEWDALGSE